MFDVFELTLMVNHACNLRCAYCYTGEKIRRPISDITSLTAIDHALNSLREGGDLQPGFSGGEPLLEADGILRWIEVAENAASEHGISVSCMMTTNGTLTSEPAWRAMTHESMSLSISHDGLPGIHDRCSNFIRTGNVSEPDSLVDRLCFRETNRVLQSRVIEADVPPPADLSFRAEGAGHAIGQPP